MGVEAERDITLPLALPLLLLGFISSRLQSLKESALREERGLLSLS